MSIKYYCINDLPSKAIFINNSSHKLFLQLITFYNALLCAKNKLIFKTTKMSKIIQSLLMCVAIGCFFSSCVSKKKFEQLMNDKSSIDQMLSDNQLKVKNLEKDITTLESEKIELDNTLKKKTSWTPKKKWKKYKH